MHCALPRLPSALQRPAHPPLPASAPLLRTADWKESGGSATVAGSYVTAGHAAELKAKGKRLSFADTSQATVFDVLGESPVAQVCCRAELALPPRGRTVPAPQPSPSVPAFATHTRPLPPR